MADGESGPIMRGLRALPPMQRLLELADEAGLSARWPRAPLTAALRREVALIRDRVLAGDPLPVPAPRDILAQAEAGLEAAAPRGLRRVLNATGIVIHTNLGRAPLAPQAIAAMAEVASAGCNLEFDLETGRRGARGGDTEALLCRLTGAEACLAVNNNAAAMLLALTALAGTGPGQEAGEVIVSRGELVEIGGGFRIPDIIQQGGARLVEVGTTNKTRLADYAAAITPRTRLLLKVHQSNFVIVGFCEATGLSELAGLARARGILLMDDLGSGTLSPLPRVFDRAEPTVRKSIEAGSNLVAFSGDKLLGGPQAGLLAGQGAVIERLRRHPLLRALRLDKTVMAALEATLRLHVDPGTRLQIPVLRMLAQTDAEILCRATSLRDMLQPYCRADTVETVGHAGGGALPGQDIASRAVSVVVDGLSADTLARRLRAHHPAIVGRIHEGRLLLDVLTLTDADLPAVAEAVASGARVVAG